MVLIVLLVYGCVGTGVDSISGFNGANDLCSYVCTIIPCVGDSDAVLVIQM